MKVFLMVYIPTLAMLFLIGFLLIATPAPTAWSEANAPVQTVGPTPVNHPLDTKALACPGEATLGIGASRVIVDLAGATASVTDDAFTGSAVLSYQWSLESGPGPVVLLDSEVLHAMTCFTVPGKYVVKLTVSDGEFTVSDTKTWTIDPPVP